MPVVNESVEIKLSDGSIVALNNHEMAELFRHADIGTREVILAARHRLDGGRRLEPEELGQVVRAREAAWRTRAVLLRIAQAVKAAYGEPQVAGGAQ